jgi:hypothetical protein
MCQANRTGHRYRFELGQALGTVIGHKNRIFQSDAAGNHSRNLLYIRLGVDLRLTKPNSYH